MSPRHAARRLRCWVVVAGCLLSGSPACSAPEPSAGSGGSSGASALPVPPRERVQGAVLRLLLIPFAPTPERGSLAIDGITRFIERRTGLRLETQLTASYEETVAALLRDEGPEAALLSPLLYVQVADRFARDPALRGVRLRLLVTAIAGGSPTYEGYITAAADGEIHDLRDVEGRPFGMVEGSTSGYLYPIDLADARGLDPERLFGKVRAYRQHPDMLADLLRPAGERPIEACALYQHIVDSLAPEVRARLRVVAKTARIPRDAVVMRVPAPGGREDPRALELAGALQAALVEMDHDAGASRALRDGIGYDGWILGDDRRYDAIRKVYQRFGHYRFGGAEGSGAGTGARTE